MLNDMQENEISDATIGQLNKQIGLGPYTLFPSVILEQLRLTA
ncbi:hypothetical protein [Aliiglaciecola sp. LCG003]|nr:hypothetical protein [Aliiglaciecola sp. LCG003]WJG09407.1 hypothetical protein QR722_19090 [Aliiglaciecola sp. LCG003]